MSHVTVYRYDGNTLLDTVESYDPIMDKWTVLETTMSTQRCDAGVAVVRKSWPTKDINLATAVKTAKGR